MYKSQIIELYSYDEELFGDKKMSVESLLKVEGYQSFIP